MVYKYMQREVGFMRNVINSISKAFIEEAQASPRMLEDLAAMEKYMSESYDGRTFVELIQNADDAGSGRIRVECAGDTLIVANDGRNFDENDIMAICRSGSSNKQRGKNIGYRGVGFKSATTISTEIVIYSAGVYFTFSKSRCAETLGLSEDKVPTVRIPFLFDENKLEGKVNSKIEELESDGFTTFFLFRNALIDKFKTELEGFNSGWLLFLRKLSNAEINLPTKHVICKVNRKNIEGDTVVKIVGSKEQWLITSGNNVSVAFRYDEEKGIIPCNSEDAVFHCFLPTTDKTGFPFKANSDFSTDPSRKHIISDDITKGALDSIAELYVDYLKQITAGKDSKKIAMLSLLNTHISLGEMASKLEQRIDDRLRAEDWVLKNNGDQTTAKNVTYLPNWLEKEEKTLLANAQPQIGYNLYSEWFYESIDKIEKMLSKYGAQEVSGEILRGLITEADKAKAIGEKITAKIFIYCFRSVFNNKEKIGEVYIPTTAGFIRLSETNDVNEIDKTFISILMATLTPKEKSDLAENYKIFGKMKKQEPSKKTTVSATPQISSGQKSMAINKWKSPIQNCLAIEVFEGRSGKDVSRKCEDYSIESVDAVGNTSYIAVKQVKTLGDSFSMTEKEYAAAQRLGEAYKIFVISTEGENVEYLYINNPTGELELEKIVKEWEFVCNRYEIPSKPMGTQSETLVDERMMKNLSDEYFNSNQKAFLKDFTSTGEMTYDEKLADMIEKINSVIDFYTGEILLEIKDNKITAESSKINAIKRILK